MSDGKYGEVTTERGSFHPGEPVFVLRAADLSAPQAICDYAAHCFALGCTEAHYYGCLAAARRLKDWQEANPSLVKKAD